MLDGVSENDQKQQREFFLFYFYFVIFFGNDHQKKKIVQRIKAGNKRQVTEMPFFEIVMSRMCLNKKKIPTYMYYSPDLSYLFIYFLKR